MQFRDKVAVVSGAGSGIGQAIAILLAKEGANVATIDHTPEEAQQTIDEIQKNGGQAIATMADISQPEQMQQVFEQIGNRWGRIDIVVANAGINGVWAPIEELSPQDWDKTLSVNLKGTFLTVKYAVPYLKRQGGSVVITASVNGTRIFSNTGATAYSCSKAAQVAFAKMIALELARYRIRVNVICPGSIKTDISENTTQQHLERIRIPVEFPQGKIPLTGDRSGTAEQVAQ
ncbi:MAG: SDR family oxidoreductase, partial [Microcystaceae cyanobacterium]